MPDSAFGWLHCVRHWCCDGDKDVTVELDPPSSSSSKRSFRTGRALRIGTPSLHRVVPQCPAAAAGAGCCDLDFLDAEGSLEFKKSVVLDQFERIGKISLAERLVTSHSLEPFQGWRTRARLAVDSEGNVGIRKKNSHDVVPVTATTVCAQWDTALVAGLPEQIEKLQSHGMIRANTELAIAVGTDGQRSVVELSGNRRHRKTKPLVGMGQLLRHTASRGSCLHRHFGKAIVLPWASTRSGFLRRYLPLKEK